MSHDLTTAERPPQAHASLNKVVEKIGVAVVYLFVLRVPVLTAVLLIALPILALSPPTMPVFENFFVLGWWPTFWAAFATLILAWSVILTSIVIVFNAPERLQVPALLSAEDAEARAPRVRVAIGWTLVGLSALPLAEQFVQPHWDVVWLNTTAVLASVVVAYALAYFAVLLAMLLVPDHVAVAREIFPAPTLLRRGLAAAHGYKWNLLLRFWHAVAAWLLKLPAGWTAGLIDRRETDKNGNKNASYGIPWAGVMMAALFALLTTVAYYGIGYGLGGPDGTEVPALCLVLLGLLFVMWWLAAGTFMIDRCRLPLLFVLLMVAVASDVGTDFAEHYYQLKPRASTATPTPADVLSARVRAGKPIIIVATMGGGIQSAAWTVQVLTGLHEQVRNELRNDGVQAPKVADSIALVSSVSGGATGTLFFLNTYKDSGFAPTENQCRLTDGECTDFAPLVNEMLAPRLDPVAWGLVYRDLPRILFPYAPNSYAMWLPKSIRGGRLLDRGWMLERSWTRSGIDGQLSTWRAGVAEGHRPAVIFNATIAETGEPLLFATTELRTATDDGESAPWRRPRPVMFTDLYPGSDVDLVTAARLASGFPYVLPVPRAQPPATDGAPSDPRYKYHLIDGGYYDNYGVAAASRWLDEGLADLAARGEQLPSEILFVQIRSFPDLRLPDLDRPPVRSADAGAYRQALPRNRGWLFELYSPIAGLMNVRTTGQLLHANDELLLLRDKWAGPTHRVTLRFATFQFNGPRPPLSFKMNPAQQNAIHTEWSKYVGPPGDSAATQPTRPRDLDQVACFLSHDALPSPQRCADARKKAPW